MVVALTTLPELSRSVILLLRLNLPAYRPRTALPKSNSRNSSEPSTSFLPAFFIIPLFTPRSLPCAYDSDYIPCFAVCHQQRPSRLRSSDNAGAILTMTGMAEALFNRCGLVKEHGCCFLERYTMFCGGLCELCRDPTQIPAVLSSSVLPTALAYTCCAALTPVPNSTCLGPVRRAITCSSAPRMAMVSR